MVFFVSDAFLSAVMERDAFALEKVGRHFGGTPPRSHRAGFVKCAQWKADMFTERCAEK